MNANDIIAFFKQHPEFFDEHPEILNQLTVPHPVNGQAISLTERQLLTLREKLAQVQGKLAELVSFGEENDVIAEKVHRLTLSLLQAESFEAVNFAVYNHLQEDFAVPHVALRIWNSILKRPVPEFIEVSEELRFYAADLRQPYCGAAQNQEILAWFGEAAPLLRSVSLIPLRRDAQIFGMLALGSEDPQRFFPEMGTMYVERIGDLVGAAVLKQIG
ncbi:DUF484 family protein [Uliginosibacterium aquaticum]|jgi:uncharacterized protein YigA (DUF484 family)|uniref:DUF484 family protein n=1 Tax=Uliginosibacterium aquaticum TaxID=2731212 RepID=A0ABX2IB85_9RHOO|nr:DUF484 family protein [Uliginosibacterium aquaticum]NSL53674.1 DUF484 family protein [Uliginosibacterium aquaticum]